MGRPVPAVPTLGQHVDTLASVTEDGQQFAATASASIAQVDVDSLRSKAGVIDLDAIAVFEMPLTETETALVHVCDGVAGSRSPWQVAPLNVRPEHRRRRRPALPCKGRIRA